MRTSVCEGPLPVIYCTGVQAATGEPAPESAGGVRCMCRSRLAGVLLFSLPTMRVHAIPADESVSRLANPFMGAVMYLLFQAMDIHDIRSRPLLSYRRFTPSLFLEVSLGRDLNAFTTSFVIAHGTLHVPAEFKSGIK